MNERIQELLVKSELLEAIGSNAYEEDGWEPIVKKFAELIVKECITTLNGYDVRLSDNSKMALLSDHFGVK